MADLKQINALKAQVEELERGQIEAKTLQKKVLNDLKEVHGLNSLEEAEKYVEKCRKTLVKNKEKLQEEYDKFISAYGSHLKLN